MNRKGFSLIELLTVIAIIGVVIAIMTPQIGTISSVKNMDLVEADLRLYSSQAVSYLHDYGGVYFTIPADGDEKKENAENIIRSLNAYISSDYLLSVDSAEIVGNRIEAESSQLKDPWGGFYKFYIGINDNTIIIASDGPNSSSASTTYIDGNFDDDVIVIVKKTK